MITHQIYFFFIDHGEKILIYLHVTYTAIGEKGGGGKRAMGRLPIKKITPPPNKNHPTFMYIYLPFTPKKNLNPNLQQPLYLIHLFLSLSLSLSLLLSRETKKFKCRLTRYPLDRQFGRNPKFRRAAPKTSGSYVLRQMFTLFVYMIISNSALYEDITLNHISMVALLALCYRYASQ